MSLDYFAREMSHQQSGIDGLDESSEKEKHQSGNLWCFFWELRFKESIRQSVKRLTAWQDLVPLPDDRFQRIYRNCYSLFCHTGEVRKTWLGI